MRILIGVALGIGLCAVFPELPRTAQSWINTAADTVADQTAPSLPESTARALDEWRSQ